MAKISSEKILKVFTLVIHGAGLLLTLLNFPKDMEDTVNDLKDALKN